jgi:hypothetical protein
MSEKEIGLIDEPNPRGGKDTLDILRHAQALTKFIKDTSTPMTIGIQGEWGSGKTSLLNAIVYELERDKEDKYLQIWVNTWEQSLLTSPEEALLKIINQIINELLMGDKTASRKSNIKNVTGNIFRGALRVGATVVGGSKAGDVTEELLGDGNSSIKELREQLSDLAIEIKESSSNSYEKIIIYVDDLDRIEPENAVRILELLKNIFSIPHCVFVLAIDYQVVVKGLAQKFGERTEENDWEFRAFFDKIIQLPFMMPMGQYNKGKYVSHLLKQIRFLDNEDNLEEEINTILGYTIGGNPRSLKRLVNSLALINIFSKMDGDADKKKESHRSDDKKDLLLFSLVCLQISFPDIYDLLSSNPEFLKWDEETAFEVTKLAEEKDADKFNRDLDIVSGKEDFDEGWEQALFRICYTKPRYRTRATDISKFFNYLRSRLLSDLDEEEISKIIDDVISQTAVTSVNATDDQQKQNKSSGYGSKFSMEEGIYTDEELKNHLVEYFSSDGKAETTIERRAKVKSYLKILLTDDRAFKRDELKSIISEKEIWKAAFDRLNPSYNYYFYVGNQMSHASKEFTKPNNDFLRQIISFDSLARAEVNAGEAGAKKDSFYLKKEYRDLVKKSLNI